MPALQFALLGSCQLSLAGTRVVQFPTAKVQALLAYLAVEAQTAHARDTLIGLFWPDYTTDSARQNLRQVLFRLRQTIPPDYLLATNQTVQFNAASDYSLDVTTFTDLITACRRHAHANYIACADCSERLQQAVALYRGDFLAGFFLDDSPAFEEWMLFKREWLRREALQALLQVAEYHARQGAYAQAQVYAWRQVELDPPREEAHQQLMRVLALSGRRSEALAQYESCRRLLAEELGVEPSAETMALYEQIRSGAFPDKETRKHRGVYPLDAGDKEKLPREHQVFLSLPPLSPSPILPAWTQDTSPASTPFVAREHELTLLHEYLDKTLAGNGQIVFVTGEAGSGKTALLREFAWRAQSAVGELLVASGHCQAQSGLGDPYLPFRHILRLLTGDLDLPSAQTLLNRLHASRLAGRAPLVGQILAEGSPALIDTFVPGSALLQRLTAHLGQPSDWLDRLQQLVQNHATQRTDAGQSDLFEQYSQVLLALARRYHVLLLIDDLHWADAASLNLLFHLGRGLADSRILLVGTYRSEDVALGRGDERHPLEPVVNELKRQYGEIVIDLDQAQGRTFVEAWLDTQPNRLGPDFRTTLYRRTQGKPLFTLELLRTMRERGDLDQDDAGHWVPSPTLNWNWLPARVEAVIEERIARLPAELRQTLAIASVEGEVFTAQVVAKVQGLQERPLLQQLSRDLEKRYRLVRRQAEVKVDQRLLTRCQFTHALFQQYLYHELSAGERRLLHGEIAAALADLYQGQTEEITVQLAHHYTEAGETAKAIEYLLQAGDRARTLYAHEEAMVAYQRALALLKQQGDYARAARTLMKLGLTYHLAFDFRQARQAYDEGFGLWQRVGETPPTVLPPAPHALRMNWLEPPTLDPAVAIFTHSHELLRQLFRGLVELSPELDVVPAVARTWEVWAGGRTYVFHLRDDVYWSDGVPVTAGDFVYAWQRVLQPANQSPNASALFDLKGARAFHQGEVSDPDQAGVHARDAHTLVVELEEPISYLLHLLTYPGTYPVPRHVVETHGAAWTAVGNLVTNGPFRLETWQRERMMVLVRNPAYYGRFTGNVQRVELSLLPEAAGAAGLALYEADDLDILESLFFPPAEIDHARQRHAGEYVAGPLLYTDFAGFNVSQPPFDDPRVRRAFVLATDRETLADVVCRGYLFPATGGFVPPGMPGHAAGLGLPYDPVRAHQLLADAGYPDGRGFPRVEALGPTSLTSVSAYLQAQWRENLGVEIIWQIMEWPIFLDRIGKELPALSLLVWLADYPDPDSFLRLALRFYADVTAWQNEAYKGLLEAARHVTDQGERMKLYGQADRLLVEEAVILPLTYWRRHLLVKPWVKRFPISPLSLWFWQDVFIEPHE